MIDERLTAIADLVPVCDTLYDIGANHGRLSIELLRLGVCQRAVLTDISAPSLEKARDNAVRAGVFARADFAVCDGFGAFEPKPEDAAIISGMGGATIAGILEQGVACPVIVQPQNGLYDLRCFARDTGWAIEDEALARLRGRFYVVMRLKRLVGGCDAVRASDYSELALRVGPRLLEKRPPLLRAYVERRIALERKARAWDRAAMLEGVLDGDE